MRNWFISFLVACLAAVVLVLFLRSAPPRAPLAPPSPVVTNSGSGTAVPAAPRAATAGATSNALPVAAATYATHPQAPPATVPPLPPELRSLPPETVMENMQTTFHQYASLFGGNPVGTNQEITRSLMGDNPKHLNFLLKADGNRVNSNGELVDVWGTPYFFHQLSGHEMEIHSAGPDRKMWTDDDLVIR